MFTGGTGFFDPWPHHSLRAPHPHPPGQAQRALALQPACCEALLLMARATEDPLPAKQCWLQRLEESSLWNPRAGAFLPAIMWLWVKTNGTILG